MAYLRGIDKLCLPVSFTGMAASLLDGGRTAHTRFRLPIKLDKDVISNIKPATDPDTELLRSISLIIWDEATTAHRFAFECVDRLFRDIMKINKPFGGIIFKLKKFYY